MFPRLFIDIDYWLMFGGKQTSSGGHLDGLATSHGEKYCSHSALQSEGAICLKSLGSVKTNICQKMLPVSLLFLWWFRIISFIFFYKSEKKMCGKHRLNKPTQQLTNKTINMKWEVNRARQNKIQESLTCNHQILSPWELVY